MVSISQKKAIDDFASHLTALGETHADVRWASIGWILPALHDPDGHEIRFYTVPQNAHPDPGAVTKVAEPAETGPQREASAAPQT